MAEFQLIPVEAPLSERMQLTPRFNDRGSFQGFGNREDVAPTVEAAEPDQDFKLIPVDVAPVDADPLVNQTLVPKGGAPRQLQLEEAQQFGTQDTLSYLQRVKEQAKQEGLASSGWETAVERAMTTTGNNILGAPAAAVNLATYPVRTVASLARGEGLPEFDTGLIGQPSVDDIAAGWRPDDPMARDRIKAKREGWREARPKSSFGGDIGGDVFSLFLTRSPFVAGLKAAKAPELIDTASKMAPGFKRMVTRMFRGRGRKKLKRAVVGKAGQVAVETAMLSAMKGNDGQDTAIASGAAAGAQFTGSGLITLLKRPGKALVGIGAATVAYSMYQRVTPDDKNFILPAIEFVLDKFTIGFGLGALASVFGAGRFKGARTKAGGSTVGGELYENMPKVADFINQILRAPWQSAIVRQFTDDEKTGSPVMSTVMEKLQSQPEIFTPKELRQLDDSARNGNLLQTIRRLSKDNGFKARAGL